MKSKKLFLALPLLASCSASVGTVSTTMAPLTTVGQKITVAPGASYSKSEFAFLDDVYYFYNEHSVMSDAETIELGSLWCELMVDGMTSEDVVMRINEGAVDESDKRFHLAVISAAVINICPSQKEKWSL